MSYQDNGDSERRSERPMFKGDWKCGKCGADIKELPFKPDPAREDQLKCRECYRQGRS